MDINQLWADEMNGKVPPGTFRKELDSRADSAVAEQLIRISALESDNTHLRECLKRLEWSKYGYACPACGGVTTQAHEGMIISGPPYAFGHRPDCWLAAAIKEGE